MTEAQAAVTVLESAVSLAIVWAVLTVAFPKYTVDRFRFRMFAIRDRLFDMAHRGEIAFDAPAYGHLRTTLNGYIRYADRLSLTFVIWDLVLVRTRDYLALAPTDELARWDQNVAALPASSREEITALYEEMHTEVSRQLVFSSPLAACLFAPAVGAGLVIAQLFTHASRSASSTFATIRSASIKRADNAAFAAGV